MMTTTEPRRIKLNYFNFDHVEKAHGSLDKLMALHCTPSLQSPRVTIRRPAA